MLLLKFFHSVRTMILSLSCFCLYFLMGTGDKHFLIIFQPLRFPLFGILYSLLLPNFYSVIWCLVSRFLCSLYILMMSPLSHVWLVPVCRLPFDIVDYVLCLIEDSQLHEVYFINCWSQLMSAIRVMFRKQSPLPVFHGYLPFSLLKVLA